MYVIRPVELNDLDRLLELTELTSFGLTTLPKDRNLLERRVRASRKAFMHLDDYEPSGQSFLFVIEDTAAQLVMGTAGIVTKVGGFEPFYKYRIECSVHESRMLDLRKEIPVLHLQEDHDGPCEIGSLFLHPDARRGGVGRALSFSRFLFMAEYPQLFETEVIAEMRGVIDEEGRSPFWDALGKHFFELEFPKADYLSIVNKEFIGDMMPRYPIYIPLLPREAQAVIGEVHELTRPARRILEKEGFEFRQQVDIFEGGPVLHCDRVKIRSIRDSRSAVVQEIVADDPEDGAELLLASQSAGFRACRGVATLMDGGLRLTQTVADALQVHIGASIRHVSLKPAEPNSSTVSEGAAR